MQAQPFSRQQMAVGPGEPRSCGFTPLSSSSRTIGRSMTALQSSTMNRLLSGRTCKAAVARVALDSCMSAVALLQPGRFSVMAAVS